MSEGKQETQCFRYSDVSIVPQLSTGLDPLVENHADVLETCSAYDVL